MASRMLRDWTTSEKIDQLSEMAELFFVRLIMKADDHGCFHANPKLLKAALFPLKDYSEKQMDICLNELRVNGIVLVYEHEGRKYLKIKDFGQRMRTMVSKFPQPADNCQQPADIKPPELEGKGREGEVEEEVKNLEWFLKQFDEIFVENLKMTHKGKDFMQAAKESYAHLAADPVRLKMAESSDCKKLLNTWLSNQKTNKNGAKKGFDINAAENSIADYIAKNR